MGKRGPKPSGYVGKKLTQARLREILIYDQYDGRWTNVRTRGGTAKAGSTAGSIDSRGYRSIRVDGRSYRSARLAILYVKGRFPRHEVDHANLDNGDDSFLNLREATHGQNQENTPLSVRNTSGWRWAYLERRTGRYRAKIKLNGKDRHIGTFDSAPEAHLAAWAASREARGPEFVRLR